MFVRFVVGLDNEHHKTLSGVLHGLEILEEEGDLKTAAFFTRRIVVTGSRPSPPRVC